MKTKLFTVVAAVPAVRSLMAKPLGHLASYRLAKTSRAIDEEVKIFYDTVKKVMEKHGLDQAPPEEASKKEIAAYREASAKAEEERRELLEQEVEIEVLQLEFADLEKVELSGAEMNALLGFVVKEPDE